MIVKKAILGLISTLWILLTSGTVFGWASFLLVYQEEGVFSWNCLNSSLANVDRKRSALALANTQPGNAIQVCS
jgi:hypothetical protein